MTYLYAAAGSLIFIFVLLIWRKQQKVRADYYLVGINLLIGCFMLSDVLVQRHLSSATLIFQNGVPLLLFPVFVLYVLEFLRGNSRLSARWLLLFVPAVLFFIWSVYDHFVAGNYPNEAALLEHFNNPSLAYHLVFKGSQLGFMAVMIGLLQQLNRFERALKQGYSTIDAIDLQWLIRFTLVYLASVVVTFVLFLGQNLGILPFQIQQVFGVVYGLLVASVFYLNYQGIQHYTLTQVYRKASLPHTLVGLPNTEVIDAPSKELTADEKALEDKLLLLIEQQQLYLAPQFSLDDLAELLGENRHKVSKVINARAGRTFYDLVNGYRVAHLKRLLDDPKQQQFTILALGLDSGFNSKASLNRIFKSVTGLSPREYLESKQKDASHSGNRSQAIG